MHSPRQLIKSFGIYSFGAMIIKLVTTFSTLLVIKVVDPAQFGVLALLNNLIALLPLILGLGLRQVLALEFFHTTRPWQLTWQLIVIYTCFALPILILVTSKLDLLNNALLGAASPPYLLLIAILTSTLSFLPELYFQLLRFQQRAPLLIAMQISMGGLMAILSLGLVYQFHLGIAGIIWAQLMIQACGALGLGAQLWKNRSEFNWPNRDTITKYLKIGLPFIPNLIFAWLIIACNRWQLNWETNLELVGIYSLAENLSLIFQTIITMPLIHSFVPQALRNMAQNPDKIWQLDAQYRCWGWYIVVSNALIVPIGLYICQPILKLILPAKYLTALPLIGPLLFAQSIFAASHLASASIQFYKKTHYLALLMGLGASLGVLINFCLIPQIGVYSCLIATNGAYITYFLGIWFFKKIHIGSI